MKAAKPKNYRKSIFPCQGYAGQPAEALTKTDAKFTLKLNLRAFADFLRLCSIKGKFFRIFRRYHQKIYGLLILSIIALLQATFLNYFRIINVKPDAILATLIIFVHFFSLGWLVVFALFAGIFRDIFSILPFGFNVIISILWVILAKQISRRLSIENNFIRSTMLFLIILLNNLFLQSLLFVLDRPIAMGIFLKTASLESIFTLLLALPMYRLFVYLFAHE